MVLYTRFFSQLVENHFKLQVNILIKRKQFKTKMIVSYLFANFNILASKE